MESPNLENDSIPKLKARNETIEGPHSYTNKIMRIKLNHFQVIAENKGKGMNEFNEVQTSAIAAPKRFKWGPPSMVASGFRTSTT